MQTIFEIFDPATGKTLRYVTAATLERMKADTDIFYAWDWVAAPEGFYVVDMRDAVKAGPFKARIDTVRKSDFENQANDYNSFSVVEHRL